MSLNRDTVSYDADRLNPNFITQAHPLAYSENSRDFFPQTISPVTNKIHTDTSSSGSTLHYSNIGAYIRNFCKSHYSILRHKICDIFFKMSDCIELLSSRLNRACYEASTILICKYKTPAV